MRIRLDVPFLLFFVTAVVHGQTCPSLIWSDEFEGGSLDEANNWSHQVGNGCDIGLCGWGNNELQEYQATNAEVSNGLLIITADREIDVIDGTTKYTSARINSIGKQSFRYGLFEARIKIPTSQGLWPAFWMLGDDISSAGWPACGELDIMEAVGFEPKTIHGTMHFGPQWPNNRYSGEKYHLPGKNFSDDFHVFGMEKFQDQIRMHVDGVVYMERAAGDILPDNWPFNEEFHFLLNVAIGGHWPGNPDTTTRFPSTMEVDYVRVYDHIFGNLEGPNLVSPGDGDMIYQVVDGLLSYQYTWSVPAGATIESGQGTSSISVSFDDMSSGYGTVSVEATSTQCGSTANRTFRMLISATRKDFSFLSSQGGVDDQASLLSSTGSLETNFANPLRSDNVPFQRSSPTVLRYARNSTERYDTITLLTDAITEPSEYNPSGGSRYFKLDVYADVLPGTTIILQFENSARNGNAYPTGRHSRYKATMDGSGQWQRIHFEYMDSPDSGETIVDQIVLLFEPDSFSNGVYFFDNLDSYSSRSIGPDTYTPTQSRSPSASDTPSFSPTQSNIPVSIESNPPADTPSVHPSSIPTQAPSLTPTSSTKPSEMSSSYKPSTSNAPSSAPSMLSTNNVSTNSPVMPSSSDFITIVSGGGESYDNLMMTTGLWYDENAANPSLQSSSPGDRPNVIGYQRNMDLYDVIFYSIIAMITDPVEYSNGTRYFTMDVYTPREEVPVEGITVLLQLENSARSSNSPYPVGRHSRYEAKISSSSSSWQQLRFNFVDFPDPTESVVDTLVLLFNPGTETTEYYYFDNLNSNLLIDNNNNGHGDGEEQTSTPSQSSSPSHIPTMTPSGTPSDISSILTEQISSDFSLVNGGDDVIDQQEAQLVFATGVWWLVSNPIIDPINPSPTVLQYRRNSQHMYDVIFYMTNLVVNPTDYTSGNRYFTMDVHYDDANEDDKEILLQLENSARTGYGYPIGRHSRYRAVYSSLSSSSSSSSRNGSGSGGWKRLRFEFVDLPDTAETVVDKIVLLFEPGSLTSNIVYYDNLDSHFLEKE